MSVEGAADLLIMDEHSAHLDSRNIDAVAELMEALKSRVQFLLAMPTNAEAGRLTWCDEQLAFFPRPPGDAYAPPIRLLSACPSPSRAREAGRSSGSCCRRGSSQNVGMTWVRTTPESAALANILASHSLNPDAVEATCASTGRSCSARRR